MPGRIERHEDYSSSHVASRNVHVWIPPGYDEGEEQYPVLYMHDGQNLFDPASSFAGVDWGVHRALARLSAEEGLRKALIVGIWNTARRIPEYMPQRPFAGEEHEKLRRRFAATYGEAPASDAYLRFLVEELKPFIDGRYRTLSGRPDTLVMGSSMGGLVSLYALCEYPKVFGGAACLSTSWTVAGQPMLRYVKEVLPPPGCHRLYFDYGVEAQIARYESLQKKADQTVRLAGFSRGQDWMTERFPGAAHSEAAWRDRVDVPLRFFLGSAGRKA